MKKSKQIILTILLTLALAGLAWLAGRGRANLPMAKVVVLRQDVAAGMCLSANDLAYAQIPASLLTDDYLTDIAQAEGLWSGSALTRGEMLNRARLSAAAAGLSYPAAAPGRRLLTIELDPADANGFWLSAGSLVDLYLIPLDRESAVDIRILEKVRILAVLDGEQGGSGMVLAGSKASPLLCLDLSVDEARLLAGISGFYELKLAVINEPAETDPAGHNFVAAG